MSDPAPFTPEEIAALRDEIRQFPRLFDDRGDSGAGCDPGRVNDERHTLRQRERYSRRCAEQEFDRRGRKAEFL